MTRSRDADDLASLRDPITAACAGLSPRSLDRLRQLAADPGAPSGYRIALREAEQQAARVLAVLRDARTAWPRAATRTAARATTTASNVARIDAVLATARSRPPKTFDPKAPLPF